MKKQLIVNSASGLTQVIFSSILSFISIPIFIKTLGIEAYGIFAIVSTVGSLNVFSDLGLNKSLIKFISEQGNVPESHIDIIVTLTILFVILLPLTILAIIFDDVILIHLLNIPSTLMNDAKWLYLFLLISNSIVLIGQTFVAVIDARQKIYLTNFIQFLYNIIYWSLILLVLLLGYSLKAVGLMTLLATFLWFVVISITALRVWGKLQIKGIKNNFLRVAKKQLSYGIKIYSAGLVGFFYEPLTKILVANFVGISEAGFFEIALKIKNLLWGVIAKFLYPLFPLLSQLSDKGRIRFVVHNIEQKIFFFITPIIVMVIFCSKSFITLWIGHHIEVISFSVIFVTSIFLIGSITVWPIYQFLIAKNHASKTIVIQIVNVFLNVTVFFASYTWLEYYAIIVGFVAAIISSFAICLYYQKKYLNSLIFDSFAQLLKVIALFCICCSVGYFLNKFLNSDWLIILIIPLTVGITAIIMYRLLGLFCKEDLYKYTGSDNTFAKLCSKILCAQ